MNKWITRTLNYFTKDKLGSIILSLICREVVCSPDTNCRKMNILELWSVFFGERIFPLYPPLGGSFIGGVPLYMDYWHNIREFNDMHCFIFGILVGVVAWKGMMVIQSVSIIMLSINEQYTIIQCIACSSLLALNRHYSAWPTPHCCQ